MGIRTAQAAFGARPCLLRPKEGMWRFCDPDDLIPTHPYPHGPRRPTLGEADFGLLVGVENSIAAGSLRSARKEFETSPHGTRYMRLRDRMVPTIHRNGRRTPKGIAAIHGAARGSHRSRHLDPIQDFLRQGDSLDLPREPSFCRQLTKVEGLRGARHQLSIRWPRLAGAPRMDRLVARGLEVTPDLRQPVGGHRLAPP